MKNCIILGSGRSGTSMAAGLFSKCGYYMGDRLVKPRPANPKGFFESPTINLNINERLLHRVPAFNGLGSGQRWLDIILPRVVIPENKAVTKLIKRVISNTPFCFKDPRFCYTLSAWLPYINLDSTIFICVFRHPNSTINSIVKECSSAKYLDDVSMTEEWASKIWYTMYLNIIKKYKNIGNWIFLHYDRFFDREVLCGLEHKLDADIDQSFPERTLKKKIPTVSLSTRLQRRNSAMYSKLLKLENM